MKKEYYLNALRAFIILLSCTSGFILACSLSWIIYDFYQYGTIGLVTVLLAPVALISFIILLITSAYAENRNWEANRLGFIIFGVVFILSTFTSIGYKMWLDNPAVLLHARYDDRHTIDLYLRKNMTVKSKEHHMLGINERYGTYHIKGDTLILKNIDIQYCGSMLVDTLIFEEDYIQFLIADNKCGIENTQMSILSDRIHHK